VNHMILKLSGLALCCAAVTSTVQATNWLMLQGTERPSAPTYRPFGFVGVDYQRTSGSPLPAGPFQGQRMVLNQIPPNLEDNDELQVSFARLGVRGQFADGKVNYFLSPLAGNNGLSKNGTPHVKFTDVSATLNLIPGARVRIGQFKQPGSEEGLQPAFLRDYVNLSNVGNQIVNERFFDSDGRPTDSANELDAPVSGFRDTGIQVFDAFKTEKWEHTYALMAGTGSGLALYNDSGSGTPDWYLYWSSELVFDGKGPRRQGLKLSGWYQDGEREIRTGLAQDLNTFDRTRYGVAATYRRGPWRLAGEWIKAEGMIFNGTDAVAVPGSISGGGAVASFNVLPDEEADGWYLDAGYTFFNKLEARVRYDTLNRGTENAANERRFDTVTLGASYRFNKNYRVMMDYQFRDVEAPRLAPTATPNQILGNVDDLLSVRFLASF
jgi:hypothetical protein